MEQLEPANSVLYAVSFAVSLSLFGNLTPNRSVEFHKFGKQKLLFFISQLNRLCSRMFLGTF